MNPPARPANPVPPPSLPPPSGDEEPGLPALHSWPAAYGFVIGCFILWVGLLVALTVTFG